MIHAIYEELSHSQGAGHCPPHAIPGKDYTPGALGAEG